MNSIIIALALLSCVHLGTAATDLIGRLKSDSCEDELFPKPPCCGIGSKNNGRITFGNKATIQEFPWMVYLECGGSLINSQWVLTAAHCIDETFLHRVHLGASQCYEENCDANAKVCNVKKIIIHEKYGLGGYSGFDDLALLQLAEPVKFTDSIRPICLPTANVGQLIYNKEAIVAGWGETEQGVQSLDLLQTTTKIWTPERCDSFIGLKGTRNSKYELCAGGEPNSSCYGDSGGPLFLKFKDNETNEPYYQVGVVKGGPDNCGRKDFAQLYVNVSSYIDWIETTILENQ